MQKRIISIDNPYHLSVKDKQLLLKEKTSGQYRQTPVEDLGVVLLNHPQISLTQSIIQELMDQKVAVVFTSKNYLPVSMLLPLDSHYIQTERFNLQVRANEPLKKQVWQQIIKAKIINQSQMMRNMGKDQEAKALMQMAGDVKSGDSTSREAKAARYYWTKLFGADFKRERFGQAPNHLLNYGYTIVRASVARALAISGLLPTLGVQHKNRYNAYCLADDLMEPYRPFVDHQVISLALSYGSYDLELDKEIKAALINVLNADCHLNGQKRTLQSAILKSAQSLSLYYEGNTKKLVFPILDVLKKRFFNFNYTELASIFCVKICGQTKGYQQVRLLANILNP
jgi:CRISPR-associated protein Cas1